MIASPRSSPGSTVWGSVRNWVWLALAIAWAVVLIEREIVQENGHGLWVALAAGSGSSSAPTPPGSPTGRCRCSPTSSCPAIVVAAARTCSTRGHVVFVGARHPRPGRQRADPDHQAVASSLQAHTVSQRPHRRPNLPRRFRARPGAGTALREAGVNADVDFGDIPLRRWRPDREHRRAQNAAGVVEAAREVAERVEAAIRSGHTPVVLGGDCTVGVGRWPAPAAGGQPSGSSTSTCTPTSTRRRRSRPARSTGWASPTCSASRDTCRSPTSPARPAEAAVFGRPDDQTQPGEQEAIERSDLASINLEEVVADPRGAAQRAAPRFESYLVHFDVDVVDFTDLPLSENTGHNVGLPFDTACAALEAARRRHRLRRPDRDRAQPGARRRGRLDDQGARRRASARAEPPASRPSGAPQSSIEAGAGCRSRSRRARSPAAPTWRRCRRSAPRPPCRRRWAAARVAGTRRRAGSACRAAAPGSSDTSW